MRVIACRAHYTKDVREIAHGLKRGDHAALAIAAPAYARRLNAADVLVPIPNHDGHARTTLALALAVADLAGCQVADVLTGKPHESSYIAKRHGRVLTDSDFDFKATEPVRGHAVLIDNVMGSGATARAATKALPGATVLVYVRVSRRPSYTERE